MGLLYFFSGIIVGYFVEKILDLIIARTEIIRKRWAWKKAENVWNKHQAISFGMEIIQTGWTNDKFLDDQVIITIDNDFRLMSKIAKKTLAIHKEEWRNSELKNNIQFGIFEIDPHRVSDEIGSKQSSHELRIRGHNYRYFEFLSTHRLLRFGNSEERIFLESLIGTPHYLEPIKLFPNPLSVGLSLFCENGNYLVLTKRTKIISSGGSWFGGSIFNAVGENVTPKDVEGDYDGKTRLSIFKTAKRGLKEEVGINFIGGRNEKLVIHSFVRDSRIMDYKFFGYLINEMSRAEVKQSWLTAQDRHESWSINFRESGNHEQCIKIVEDIVKNREEWASESNFCTIRSLLHTGKITSADLDAILANT